MSLLPPPFALGLPDQFEDWRQHQPDAIWRAIESEERFAALVLPTGAGKSLTTMSIPMITGWRTAFLTSTKNLQLQYSRDFQSIGLTDIRGQQNYRCVAFDDEHLSYKDESGRWQSCEEGPCHTGLGCSRKPTRDDPDAHGCDYYDALASARKAKLVISNYKLWLTQWQYGMGLGRFDCLVLDEAHNAPEELASFLSTPLLHRDLMSNAIEPPPEQTDLDIWARWAKATASMLARKLDEWKPRNRLEMSKYRGAKRLMRKLETLALMKHDSWVLTLADDGWHFDPVWVSAHRETLCQMIPKIILTSATFTRKTAEMLGIENDKLAWHETPSDFPVSRRPVYYVPTVRLDYRADDYTLREWISRIDQILRARQDRKGIVHTVSYKRRNEIIQRSEFAHRMITHDSGNSAAAIEKFRSAGPGAILISPSMTTGYDFPMEAAEFQILTKLPFPDTRSPVVRARLGIDPDYANYIMAQELVQAVGRGMRSRDDQCENFIVDDNFKWARKKCAHLFPQWFMESIIWANNLPSPLPKLGSMKRESSEA